MSTSEKHTETTRLIHAGRPESVPTMGLGTVNQPVYHCSTLLYDTFDQLRDWAARKGKTGETGYGIGGTDLTHSFEALLAELENGYGAFATNSGLTAITIPLLAQTKAGDHVLIVDSVYSPTRGFADHTLSKFGVEVEYYEPTLGTDIEKLVRPNTSVIFMESPGSVTFEIQDVPAIVAVAKKHGITTIIDNTWATPLYFKPLDLGVDISCHAVTKYIAGHSDLMGGAVICNERTYLETKHASMHIGNHQSPDDVFLAFRGLRTLEVRLKQHEKNGLIVAEALQNNPLVSDVLHPALPTFATYDLWKRDFTGTSGLFSFVLDPRIDLKNAEKLVEDLALFGIGYSWGGYESLAVIHNPHVQRSSTAWPRDGIGEGVLVRVSIGLEDPADIIRDLETQITLAGARAGL